MYIIGVESSKTRGMGHFFRSLLYASYLQSMGKPFLLLINRDERAINILEERELPFRIVDYSNASDWETPIIQQYGADVWLQDKFETSAQMAAHIKKNDILLCAIDDFGSGADLCDIHFGGMIYLTGHEMRGKKLYFGPEYVILNPEIDRYRRVRTSVSNVVISLGGSDPYGMTVEVVKRFSKTDYPVEVIIGPDFDYRKELDSVNVKNYPILQNVPSLIAEFSKFDLAVTGGGVTCCEANSCGIPCIIIANAPHEMHTAALMQSKGGAIFAGSFEGWDRSVVDRIPSLDIERMSRAGMDHFDTRAIERVFSIIEQELSNERREVL